METELCEPSSDIHVEMEVTEFIHCLGDNMEFSHIVPPTVRPKFPIENEEEVLMSQESSWSFGEKLHSSKELTCQQTRQSQLSVLGPADQSTMISLPQCHSMERLDLGQSSFEGDLAHEKSEHNESIKKEYGGKALFMYGRIGNV